MSESIEKNLQLSMKCYEQALALLRGSSANAVEQNKRKSSSKPSSTMTKDSEEQFDYTMVLDTLMVTKRLGNVKNDLGVYYMNLTTALLSKDDGTV